MKSLKFMPGAIMMFIFSFISTASASTPQALYEQGYSYIAGSNGNPKDGVKADELLAQAAAQGHRIAQLTLGSLYLRGYKDPQVMPDREKSFRYLSMAAEQGDPTAMCRLGEWYKINPNRTPQDLFEAFKWFLKSAELKDEIGMLSTAEAYLFGEGTQMSAEKAEPWVRRLAVFGNARAQYYLGHMYYQGDGVEKDLVQAVSWLEKAREQGEHAAMLQLGNIYYDGGPGVPKDMIKALTYWEESSEKGNDLAPNLLAGFLMLDGPMMDVNKAFKYYEIAANRNNDAAMIQVAKFYLNGEGVEKDPEKAVEWLEKAVALDNVEAQSFLASLRRDGVGMEKDSLKAGNEMLLAAHRGDPYAQFDLGLSYLYGLDLQELNLGQAFLWFEKAADQGLDLAQRAAGEMLYNGEGITMDRARGIQYYQRAASQGEPIAIDFLKSKGLEIPAYEDFAPKAPAEDSALNTDNWGSL